MDYEKRNLDQMIEIIEGIDATVEDSEENNTDENDNIGDAKKDGVDKENKKEKGIGYYHI